VARRIVVHPLLLAAWPVLFLFAQNVGETATAEVLPPLVVVLGGTALLLAVLTLVLRDARRAGFAVSTLAVSALAYGHVRNVIGGGGWLPVVWLALTAVLLWLSVRARRAVPEMTAILNGVAAILVVLSLVTITTGKAEAAHVNGGAGAGATSDGGPLVWQGEGPPRDIYYIVLDRYGSEAGLAEGVGVDNSAFMDALADRGFTVLPDSHANHLKTAESLASTFNLRFLLDLEERYGPDTDNLGPVYELLDDHRAGRLLKSAGYTFVQIGSWWDPTASSSLADLDLGYGSRSDFESTLLETSLLSALPEDAPVRAPGLRQLHREAAVEQFSNLRRVAGMPRPTFTFAHILLPHEPYVFTADGGPVSGQQELDRTRFENFSQQLAYTNTQLGELLDTLLAGPEERDPVIILQADEGPHPVRYERTQDEFDWTEATDAELREKFSILNAWYLPGVDDPALDDAMTSVNTFPTLFNTYFGTDIPLLEDRSYVFRDAGRVYDFTEITDRLSIP